ncbi:MAG: sensor histidine kinase [Candidatus Dadabacteria bacterium]|nr:MAG: sensor histidine kinase [Candidatus Dadabacteria bacterium]
MKLKYLLVLAWITFTVALTSWWYIFSQRQLKRLAKLSSVLGPEIIRNHRMLLMEGIVLILCLVGGGVALLYYIYREKKQSEKLRQFFATFSHELKTPLASLKLQAESLKADLPENASPALINRLIDDTARLTLQLENSLLLSSLDDTNFYPEALDLKELIENVSRNFPEISADVMVNSKVLADHRALNAVFANLIRNALIHGGASKIEIKEIDSKSGKVELEVKDNGRGFKGDAKKLGRAFFRHNSSSGNGLGLYLCRKLVAKSGGKLSITNPDNGFTVKIVLPASK